MTHTFNINHSISLLKANQKIYKKPLKDVAMMTVKYHDTIDELETKQDRETIKFLDKVLLGKEAE
jgi:hypothetical protein